LDELYFVNLEREILCEMGSSVIADYMRFINKNGIDIKDNKNIIVIMFQNLVELKNNLFSKDYNTLDALKILEGEFKFAKVCIDNLKTK
jgi:hypothetical protein